MGNYALTNNHFIVEWGGERVGFSEVSGLDIEYSLIAYREGAGSSSESHLVPGELKPARVKLKRGMVKDDNEFYLWITSVNLGSVERRDVFISMLNEVHAPIFTWKLVNAWPVKYSGPELNANQCEIAIESLELACEFITMKN